MLYHYPITAGREGSAAGRALRVGGITVKGPRDGSEAPTDVHNYKALLWGPLDLCAAAEQRSHVRNGSDNIPAALVVFQLRFTYKCPANVSLIGPLAANFPALPRSLQVLTIEGNNCDESARLGDIAALATHLTVLTFYNCGLTSLRGLAGRCVYLQKLDLMGCHDLSSIEGLGDHRYLQDLDVSATGITSVEPLRTCPALIKVNLWRCQQLSSIRALEYHQQLVEVNASNTGITSVEPLLTCPALKKVVLWQCKHLPAAIPLPLSVDITRESLQ